MTPTRTFNNKTGEPWEIYSFAANRKAVCRVHIEEMVKRYKLLPLSSDTASNYRKWCHYEIIIMKA